MANIGLIILAVILGSSCLFVLHRLVEMGTFSKSEDFNTENCKVIEENLSGPEDIQVDSSSGILYISNNNWTAFIQGKPEKGGIYVLDLKQNNAQPKLVSVDQPANFHPQGISLYQDPKTGEKTLFVVNHLDKPAIEIFDVIDRDTIKHRETLSYPLLISANDIVGTGKRSFYVTQDTLYHPGDFKAVLATLFGLEGSAVFYYDGENWKNVATDLNYANGIVTSPNGKFVYVAESTGRRLRVYERNIQSGELTLKSSHDLHCGPDNINIDEEGNLWIGGIPNLMAFNNYIQDRTTKCPAHIIKVTIKNGEVVSITKPYSSSGETGAPLSSAAIYKDKLILSGLTGPEIKICNVPKDPLPIRPMNRIDL